MSRIKRAGVAVLSAAALAVGTVPFVGGTAVGAGELTVTPARHLNTSAVDVTITGTTFLPFSDTVTLTRHGAGETVEGVVNRDESSMSKLVARFDVTGALDGLYDVTVSSLLGTSSCTSCFTVTAPPPAVSLTAPASVIPGGPAATAGLKLTNPPTGATYDGRVRFVLSGVPNLAASHLALSLQTGPSTFVPVQLTATAGTLVGYVGPESGVRVGRNFDLTAVLRVAATSAAPAGTMRIDTTFGRVGAAGNLTDQLATDHDNVVISGVPGAPTNVRAVAGIGKATLTWTAPTRKGSSPISGYLVRTSPACSGCTGLKSSSTSTTVRGLTKGRAYTFTVTARNAAGYGLTSAASNRVTIR